LRKLKAELILLFVAGIWGGTFFIIKLTLIDLPPFYFLAVRFFTASMIFGAVFYTKIRFNSIEEIKAGIFLGILLFLGFASQTSGLLYTTASKSALITGMNTLVVPFAQLMIIKKKVGFSNWIGVLVLLIGLYLLTNPQEFGINYGDLLTLICVFAWAFYIIYIDIFSRKFSVHVLVIIQFITVFFISISIALGFENFAEVNLTKFSIFGLLYTSILATLIATFLGNKYQKETSPAKAAIIFTFEQPSAVILAIIFLAEKLTELQYLGGLLMLAGILFPVTFEYIRPDFDKVPEKIDK
jgi:drug/metabolite transporter (DMT)-like permease